MAQIRGGAMRLKAEVSVKNGPDEVWETVSDFENCILTSPSIKTVNILGGEGHLRKHLHGVKPVVLAEALKMKLAGFVILMKESITKPNLTAQG